MIVKYKKINISVIKILMSIFFTFCTLCGSGLGEYSVFRNITLILVLIYNMFYIFIRKEKIIIPNNFLNYIWMSFGTMTLVSCMYNNESILNGIFNFIIVPTIYFYILNSIYKENLYQIIIDSFYYSCLLITLLCLISKPITYPYEGIFKNPNTLAIVLTSFIMILLIKLHIEDKHKYLSILLIISILFFITQTGSRTALIISVLLVITKIFIINFKFNSTEKVLKSIIKLILFSCILFKMIKKNFYLFDGIIKKSQNSSEIFSGRENIWEHIINNINLLGNGEHFAIDAHNTFMQILASYGIIVLIIFIIMTVINIYCSINNYIIRSKYFELEIFTNITFVGISMTEGIYSPIGNSLTILWILIYGLNMYNLKNKKCIRRKISEK